jgi:2-alkenal reductase
MVMAETKNLDTSEQIENITDNQPLIVDEIEELTSENSKHYAEKKDSLNLKQFISIIVLCAILAGSAGGGLVYLTFTHRTSSENLLISELNSQSSQALLLLDEKSLLESESNTIAVVNKSIGSVVQVLVSKKQNLDLGGLAGILYPSQQKTEQEIQGNGTGFVFRSDGLIITNYHVIEGMDSIHVILQNGKSYEASVIGSDKFNDLAVIKIETQDETLIPLPLADSRNVQVGQKAIAIGCPLASTNSDLGLNRSPTVSEGIVSATDRSYPITSNNGNEYTIENLLQTSANINQGSSGGPLLNSAGEVIGVTSAGILSADGIGFAIPSTTVYQVATAILEGKTVGKALLGVQSLSLNVLKKSLGEDYHLLGLPVDSGSMIIGITPGSAAEKAGLKGATEDVLVGEDAVSVGGDIIIRLNGTIIVGDNIVSEIRKYNPGDEIVLTILRGDKTLEIPVILGALTE